MNKPTPRTYRTVIEDSGDAGFINRLLVGTATTGLVRIEWVGARYGQVIPTNWSHIQLMEYLESYVPLRYQVADAQNLIVKEAVEKDYEWCLFLEHDVILPPDAFIRFNDYIRECKVPVMSGLYYTRSRPSEPLIYRGRGNSFYGEWKMGDRVWCDGVPTGCLLVHVSLLKAVWNESPEYAVRRGAAGIVTRRVFDTPRAVWVDPQTGQHNTTQGTSDLDWCTRVMKGGFFEKAGWKKYQKMEYPFLVDTQIFCRHIDQNGEQFP